MTKKRFKVAVQGWSSGSGAPHRFFAKAESAERFAQRQAVQSWLQRPWSVRDLETGEVYTISAEGRVARNLTWERERREARVG